MTFALSHSAFACLKAQTNLTGCFSQILRDPTTGASVKASLEIELYLDQVTVVIRMDSSVNTLTLPANSIASARKIASHLEAIANGQHETADLAPVNQLLEDAA